MVISTMKNYELIVTTKENEVLHIELNRPGIHNAFDDKLIKELYDVFAKVEENNEIRILVLTGRGKSFCAGADLNWMHRMKNFSFDQNYKDSYELAKMLEKLHTITIPTIAKVNGAAIGGGLGLVAACDISIASTQAIFSLSEVKLGLVPACISPYLIKRVNKGMLRHLFLTGTRFDAVKAKEIGLVNEAVQPDKLDEITAKTIKKILSCGPKSLTIAKELLEKVPYMKPEEYMKYNADLIAKLRVSDEGQEGLGAFLEKRKPAWNKNIRDKEE